MAMPSPTLRVVREAERELLGTIGSRDKEKYGPNGIHSYILIAYECNEISGDTGNICNDCLKRWREGDNYQSPVSDEGRKRNNAEYKASESKRKAFSYGERW